MAVPDKASVNSKTEDSCGFACLRPKWCQKLISIRLFVFIMCCVIAVQGTYLGYMVGVLTSIERHFDVSSSERNDLQIRTHKNVNYGHLLKIAVALLRKRFTLLQKYTLHSEGVCSTAAHTGAYAILVISQLLAGIAAAPFNTLAYVYIDDNVTPRQSPLFLGLLTSMYAFGPAFGFALSAGCNALFVVPMAEPVDVDMKNPNWVGAWWLGYLICSGLYVIFAIPLFCFPINIAYWLRQGDDENSAHEMQVVLPADTTSSQETEENDEKNQDNFCLKVAFAIKGLPYGIAQLLKNPVYVSMGLGWILGSYLVGGYGTYLPKYIETQYSQSAAMGDIYAGIIAIGSVAVSTAAGGYILTRFNIHPRKAILLLALSWGVIVLTYLLGMGTGCPQPTLVGADPSSKRWNFTNSCNKQCVCNSVHQFDPICSGNLTYFSPCHAGCSYSMEQTQWTDCMCTTFPKDVQHGYCPVKCNNLPIYLSVMFVGLFIGNLFFMTTMMVVLRCVRDEQKSLALSVASGFTNVFGFIPSPIVFGAIIDTSCAAWHSLCPTETGNCILYNNMDFRHKFHLSNAAFQLAAVLAVSFTWFKARHHP